MGFWKKKDGPSKREIEDMQDAKFSLAENLPAHAKIVDLSGIYLKEVPHGILSVIKFQNKECLILKNNQLKTLGDLHNLDDVIKLDLSFNLFKTVPNSLSSCVALVQLSLDNNELKTLPAVLGSLQNLESLSAANNKITAIAPEIGALRKLSCLILKNNNITRIPDNFAYCYALTTLDVDVEKLTYPPSEVVVKGGKQTVLWLCEENNVDTSMVEVDGDLKNGIKIMADISQQERAAEEAMLKRQEKEAAEQAEILARLKEEEEAIQRISEGSSMVEEARMRKIKKKMEAEDNKEKKKLSEYLAGQESIKMANIRDALKEVEDKDIVADEILREIERMRNEERERLAAFIKEDEETFKKYVEDSTLDMKFISDEMQKVLEEEALMDSFVANADKQLQEMFKSVQDEERNEDEIHKKVVNSFEADKKALLGMIMDDEELQRQLFITAQQEHDKLYKALTVQIESVQENLMLLTILEKNQKDLDEQVMSDVASQRAEMAGLLAQLMVKQDERRDELAEHARMIENQFEDDLANFWLYQYQMLMASKPAKILREEEEAIHAARKNANLEKPIGNDEYQGPSVLPAAWASAPPEQTPSPSEPSAPTPSAPSPTKALVRQQSKKEMVASEQECCICLDAAPSVAFLPCGHVCCCSDCGIVSICPMCRAEITSTVKLYFTN